MTEKTINILLVAAAVFLIARALLGKPGAPQTAKQQKTGRSLVMPQLLLNLLSGVLPDVLKRVLPAEKISETEQARIAQALQTELLKQDWAKIEAEFKDRDSARNLAAQEIAKGNALTASLAAFVRPVWGLGCFALVAHSVLTGSAIGQPLQAIVELTLMFYFGGRTLEKVAPLTAAVLKK